MSTLIHWTCADLAPQLGMHLARALHDRRMTTTPIWWIPLVVAVIGLCGVLGGGLGGVMFTQRHANHREDTRWQREREREQALWAREDAARSYEHRRAAYVDFIKEFHCRREELASGNGEKNAPWYDMLLYDLLMQIQIFGTNKAAQPADEAFNALINAVEDNEDIPEAEDVLAPLRSEIRRDLSIPSLAQDSRSHP